MSESERDRLDDIVVKAYDEAERRCEECMLHPHECPELGKCAHWLDGVEPGAGRAGMIRFNARPPCVGIRVPWLFAAGWSGIPGFYLVRANQWGREDLHQHEIEHQRQIWRYWIVGFWIGMAFKSFRICREAEAEAWELPPGLDEHDLARRATLQITNRFGKLDSGLLFKASGLLSKRYREIHD